MRNLLASTATIIALTATGAFADAHTSAFSDMSFDEASNLNASEIIGMRVYASEAEMEADMTVEAGAETEWDDIGEINEIVLNRDGSVEAVIVGVGGFLGIGEKDVAIMMDQLQFVSEEGDDADEFFLVVNAAAGALEDAPEYNMNGDMMNSDMSENEETEESDMAENDAAAELESTSQADVATEENMADADMTADEEAEMAEGEEAEMAEGEEAEMAEGEMAEGEEAEMAEGDTSEMAENEEMPANRDMLMRPEMEREGYADAVAEDLTTEDLTGAVIYGANDENIGEVDSLLLNENNEIDQIVLNIGGFLGLGEHQIAVTMDEVQILRSEDGSEFRVYIDATQEALEAQPEYEG